MTARTAHVVLLKVTIYRNVKDDLMAVDMQLGDPGEYIDQIGGHGEAILTLRNIEDVPRLAIRGMWIPENRQISSIDADSHRAVQSLSHDLDNPRAAIALEQSFIRRVLRCLQMYPPCRQPGYGKIHVVRWRVACDFTSSQSSSFGESELELCFDD